VTLQDIYAARHTIAPWIRRTPLIWAEVLSRRIGHRVFLKLESLQDTGSFKLRGAVNALARLAPAARQRGVVTVSTGNHGRAVAFAARRLGIRAVVCMSHLVPTNKVRAVEHLGAEVRIVGASQDAAQAEAERLVAEDGLVLVPPFDHPDVIAGQGVIGLEILEDLAEADCLVAGLSGGGLISGMAIALKAASPGIRVVGVSSQQCPAMSRSLQAGHPVLVEERPSLADSLGGGIGLDNRYTFDLVRRYVDDVVLVNEAEITAAMASLYWEERLVVEGAGAVGIAALLADHASPRGQCTVVVLSGANVDMAIFTRVVTNSGAPSGTAR